jgi:superfamily II DNA/RNA helicase
MNTEQILSNLGIAALNEMQKAAIEACSRHNEVILLSDTGSGKTIAFLLPIIAGLDADKRTTQAIIIVPSRELAQQIERVFKQMGTGFKITTCYGGHKRETEENNLVEAPALIIGTPGRLADHIRRQNITTDTITTLVLDEFDKSLELGFDEEMSFIAESLPAVTKKILTSATRGEELPPFMKLEQPEVIDFLTEEEKPAEVLAIKKVISPDKDKAESLFKLICYIGNRSAIIFCNHRESVERVSNILTAKGISNEFYHGAMEQQERDSALCKFRNGTTNVLVTTDLASRGLDIPNIRYIIHYHLPHTEDIYTHRNGRTARMDASGTAILLLSTEETMPPYVTGDVEEIILDGDYELPEKPKWATLFIAAGKKDKVNKVDIVGFLAQKGQLKKEDIGLIEVKDFFSFAAVKKVNMAHALHLIKDEKLKGKKIKISIAK